MKLRRKLFVLPGVLIAVLLVLLFALPVFLAGPLSRRAHVEIDKAVAAHVDWSHASLTFFRAFPNLTLSLENLTVIGSGAAGTDGVAADSLRQSGTPDRTASPPDTIASVGDLRLVVDLASAFGVWRGTGPLVVRSIRLDDPRVRLLVRKDGTANWSLIEPTTKTPSAAPAPASRAMSVNLQGLDVAGGDISFTDERSGLDAAAHGLAFSLSGDLAQNRAALHTRTHADSATVRFAGVPWLDHVAVDFQANVDADLEHGHFTFQDNQLKLNGLVLAFAGQAMRRGDGIDVDVRFNAPRTEFGQALSLVPAIYAQDFASLKTSGTFTVQGTVKGMYARASTDGGAGTGGTGTPSLPALTLHATVDNGTFRYPDQPLPARDIGLDLTVDKPAGPADGTVIHLDRLHALIGDQPLDAELVLRTPISDPDVDASVRGTLDLGALSRTVKLPKADTLRGVITADASLKGRLSDMDAGRYDRVNARGSIAARDVKVRSATLGQPMTIHDAALDLSPRYASLESFDADIGSSDVQAHGRLDDILGFVLGRDPLRGSATFSSKHFALDEWKSGNSTLQVVRVPANLDLTLDGTIAELTYGPLTMTDAHGKAIVKDQRLTLDGFGLQTLGGRMAFTGSYDTSEPGPPRFDMSLSIDSVDIPRASAALATVRALVPVAHYTKGTFSTQLKLRGALGNDMTPVLDALNGSGSLRTSPLSIEGFPPLTKLAGALSLPKLDNPTVEALRSTIAIQDGRLHVRPFDVHVAGLAMTVQGSNGIDQSMDYTLGLTLPRSLLGSTAGRVVQDLAAKAGKAGLNLAQSDSVRLGVHLAGAVTAPSVDLGLGGAVASTSAQAKEAVTGAVDEKAAEARARADSAAAAARRRAQARADSIMAEARAKADQVRADAKALADKTRAEADRRAEEVVAKATNPIAKVAAQKVADSLRKEADKKANDLVAGADRRADAMVAEARKQADAVIAAAGGGDG